MNQTYIPEPEAIRLLQQHGIAYPRHEVAHSADEAAAAADRLGYPVVLKVVSPDVMHKTDAGGVVAGLDDAAEVRAAHARILDAVQTHVAGARIEGILVCQQAPAGLEVIVGALEDATFGPTVMFGLGGIFTEIMKDVSFRVAPLQRRDAEEMIREIKAYPALAGARGQATCDVDALVELLLAVSRLVSERSEIKELDLNPVRLYEHGLQALDVRLVVKE